MFTGLAYKQNTRQSRTVGADEIFNLGMYYSSSPITEGFSKVLLNLDTDALGESLTPRPGFRVKQFGIDAEVNPVLYDTDMALFNGKVITDEANHRAGQVIIGMPTDTKINDTGLYKGTGYFATVQQEAPVAGGDPNLVQYPMLLKPMQDAAKEGHIFFTKPETANIHGMLLSSTDGIARHVGTYAFNNMYYYFAEVTEIVYSPPLIEGHPLIETPTIFKKLMKSKLHTDGTYISEVVTPKEVSPTEAVQWGYNMLKENPFTFENENFLGTIQLVGLLPYDADGKIVMNPLLNQKLKLKAFYAGSETNTYDFKWEWKDTGSSAYTTLKTLRLPLSGLPDVEIDFSSPAANIIIQLSATKIVDGTPETMPEKVIAMGISFLKEENKNNVEMKNYDLSTASGMAYWKNRLVVWGVPSNPMSLFMSDVNDPSYFPYPNSSDILEEPIMLCVPVNDTLLVFTSSSLYMITLGADGLSWYKKKIQSNLNISPWDIHLTQTVKGMVFFKSGNYYYMVVPSKTNIDNLVVAPVSKNIMPLLDNFDAGVKELLNFVYGYSGTLELEHYYNFLDFEDVHNVYVFKDNEGVYINVMLLYNTLSRAWRMYAVESESIILPYQQDMTKSGILMALTPVLLPGGSTVPAIQFMQKDYIQRADYYIPQDTLFAEEGAFTANVDAALELCHKYKNWQFYDSGAREQSTSNKKRYREIQMKLNNLTGTELKFYTDFSLDGEQRYNMARYEVQHETDPASPNYGLITMERVFVDPSIVPGTTVLADVVEDYNYWSLDQSVFPDVRFWKIRVNISGKGYTPRMRIMSQNEEAYEILNISWVSRMMNAR